MKIDELNERMEKVKDVVNDTISSIHDREDMVDFEKILVFFLLADLSTETVMKARANMPEDLREMFDEICLRLFNGRTFKTEMKGGKNHGNTQRGSDKL